MLHPLVGNTPVIALSHSHINLFAKLEYYNLTGSVKDRSAYHSLRKAVENGNITKDTVIVESSSGNFASSLAQICNFLEIKFIPVVDPNISPLYLGFLRSLCEEVVMVKDMDESGGYLKTRIKRVHDIIDSISNSYWINQYENPYCAEAHYLGTAKEIFNFSTRLDYLFVGVSSGGTLSGVSRGVRELSPNTMIVAVDIEGSMIFQAQPKVRFIPGMGSSIRPKLLDSCCIDKVVHVSESNVVKGCRALRNQHGILAGGSSGAVYFAIDSFFKNHPSIKEKPEVMFLCPDRGTAYIETVYNDEWVRSKGLI
ncbi:MAG: 2,3-diaminopropionate biosynthesis protein SbnA [Halobacteriovoraceae bacterium]|nr:2,3-diaminopropionate biosynthesis protein SbnA [Halobacteriovoraceae bacterium]|tara:strand:+ start:28896 stop:29828 length:933 start_codon:yes stop_codon:yes gene_type:complete